jgi:hypothetical protein
VTARRQWLPLAVGALAAAAVLLRILQLNQGKFIYSMDDPYIHLALATHIAEGHYGITSGQYSAPASSVLWPLLLAPFSMLAIEEHVPLIINLVAAGATLILLGSILDRAYAQVPGARWAVPILQIILIPFGNLLGLAFTGMEHSLQVWLSLLVLWGMVVTQMNQRPPWWLMAAAVIAPLVRYECLALSLPALAYLWLRGHRRGALRAAVVLGLCLGAFSLFLYWLELGVLPTSVRAKALVVPGAIGTHGLWVNLWMNFFTRQGIALLAGALLLLAVAAGRSRPRADRALATVLLAAVALHMGFGQFGWQDRYEIYVRLTTLMAVLWVLRADVRLPLVRAGLLAYVVIGGFGYARTLWETPASAHGIYRQQYQMHRFTVDYLRAPAATDDLGWMSYRNPHRLLDLYGLASEEALRCRDLRCEPDWMDRLAKAYGVQLAMIFRYQFPDLPSHWLRVGQLRLAGRPEFEAVDFLAVDPSTRFRIDRLLGDFRRTLPPGVRFVFEGEEPQGVGNP